jgi:pimeloyl-ACP methyl ester carboxylesterase
MVDDEYGAVLRPDWAERTSRWQHPGDGSTIYAATDSARARPGGAPPLLLLHGVGNSGAIFRPILPTLAEHGPVAAPTMSPELLMGGAIEPLVDWLSQVYPPPWRLVGHSMGGLLIGLILRARPDVAAGALLVNAPLPGVVQRINSGDTLDRTGRAVLAMKALARVTSVGRPRVPKFLRGAELAIVRNALRGFVYEPFALDGEVIGRAIVASRTVDGVDFLELAHDLPDVEGEPFTGCPVSILLGDSDPLVPMSDHATIAKRYPDATIQIAPTCGHFAHLERPRLTVDLIDEFFGRRALH